MTAEGDGNSGHDNEGGKRIRLWNQNERLKAQPAVWFDDFAQIVSVESESMDTRVLTPTAPNFVSDDGERLEAITAWNQVMAYEGSVKSISIYLANGRAGTPNFCTYHR